MPSRGPRHAAAAAIAAVWLLLMTACTGPDQATRTAEPVAAAAAPEAAPEESGPTFINLLPWGEVDFARGAFPTRDACNEFVRGLPTYSFYTTPERCEPLADPVYCTVWREGDDPAARLGCFKGVGGCEVELRRHDLRAESGAHAIVERCQPHRLADAWALYQAAPPTSQ